MIAAATGDTTTIKQAVSGRMIEILQAAGIDRDCLDGKHHPCPKCGGHDRFRLLDADAGAVFCNQCFSSGNGDLFSAVQWLHGCDFPTAKKWVADYLHVGNGSGQAIPMPSGKPKPAKQSKPTTTYATVEAAIASVGKGNPSAQWQYHDASGQVVGYVCRWDTSDGGKDIRPISMMTDGRWAVVAMPSPRPLYALPGIPAGDHVWIAEGEKAADELRSVGIVATTAAGGANGAKQTDWTPLAGKHVTIWRDNDDSGERYADDVSGLLSKLGCKVDAIDVTTLGLPPKGDAYDWMERHDAVEPHTLRELIESLPTVAVDDADTTPAQRLTITPASDLVSSHPVLRPPVVHGILRRAETANIIAAPKIGKSYLALSLAYAVANGKPWLGHDTEQGRVLILDNELHSETLASRLRAVGEASELSAERIDVVSLRGHTMDIHGVGAWLRTADVAGRYSLIIMDALYRFWPGGMSENDNAGVMGVYNAVDAIAADTQAAIVLVHHSSKGDQSGKGITDMGAGAGSISRAADAHLIIRPHELADCAVLDGVTRSFVSPEAMTIQWEYPLWTVKDIEPAVKQPKKNARQDETDSETLTTLRGLLEPAGDDGLTASEIRSLTGWGDSRAKRGMWLAERDFARREKGAKPKDRRAEPDRIFWKLNEDEPS